MNEKKINDGGPAFPRHFYGPSDSGMTLRDYFAAAALEGMLAAGCAWQNDDNAGVDAYSFADAMLRARAQEAKP